MNSLTLSLLPRIPRLGRGLLLEIFNSLSVVPLITFSAFRGPPLPNSLNFDIILKGLYFQDPSLPSSAIVPAWLCWYSSLSGCFLKRMFLKIKTAIAAALYHTPHASASLVPHINSVFTAEPLAIHLALTSLPTPHKNIIIISDSLSTPRALKNWSMKSPKVILLLLSDIYRITQRRHSISLVWCPGYKGPPTPRPPSHTHTRKQSNEKQHFRMQGKLSHRQN